MTIHMVRVLCEPPKGEAENAVENWVANYSEWTEDTQDHTLTAKRAGPNADGTVFVDGVWRFVDQGEEPTNILADLSDRLGSLQGGLWHRLLYHVCYADHDGPETPDCTWGMVVEGGRPIPGDIPMAGVA